MECTYYWFVLYVSVFLQIKPTHIFLIMVTKLKTELQTKYFNCAIDSVN